MICTLDDGASIRMEFTVTERQGLRPGRAEPSGRRADRPDPVDALYSPVKRVAYRVEPTRQGQVLDYDKLIIEVETNGAVTPEDAVAYAARILQDQLQTSSPSKSRRRRWKATTSPTCRSTRRC